jgi:predicted MPP superfamily phosphohydrolase
MAYFQGSRPNGSGSDALGETAPGGRPVVSFAMRRAPETAPATPVRARILWPALGFPAVVAPRTTPGTSPMVQGDATRSICVLVASNRRWLSKAEAARYLRCVPWEQRSRRHIPAGQPGSFREEELVVHNTGQPPELEQTRPKDRLGGIVTFGANAGGGNGIAANLSKYVRDFYRQQGLEHLHEIRVYETASAQLPDGRYHLFWNNEAVGENVPSDEMTLLLERFARPRRTRLGALWQTNARHLMDEYEFEYGGLHSPYKDQGAPRVRAEILHPLVIRRDLTATLRIGQLTDTHVDVRADVYEANLRGPDAAQARANYQNWNRNFTGAYNDAKKDSDAILLTGDIVDYGRGHWGPDLVNGVEARLHLGKDGLYHEDRNWFLFYYLLASGDAYSRPVYSILGNHDWRINPYPPFPIGGAPEPSAMFTTPPTFTREKQKEALQKAHGPGHDRAVAYNDAAESKYRLALRNWRALGWQLLLKLFGGDKTLDVPGLPTETTVESIAWYLLAINPFLDYRFTLPRGHSVLMLDWVEDENVFFGSIYQGKRYASVGGSSAAEGPVARNSLSDLQVDLVKQFTEMPGAAKIIGIHAPPIGPWSSWNDQELATGWKSFDFGGRGYPHYRRVTPSGTVKGHPLFAIRPKRGIVPDAVHGMDASYNSFDRHRPWFIKRVADPRFGVRLVLSGHIHRRGLFIVFPALAENAGPTVAGELLIRSVREMDTQGVRAPAGAKVTVPKPGEQVGPPPGPLYVNSTSVGPRGNMMPAAKVYISADPGYTHLELANDGTILRVDFRWMRNTTAISPPLLLPPPRLPTPAHLRTA